MLLIVIIIIMIKVVNINKLLSRYSLRLRCQSPSSIIITGCCIICELMSLFTVVYFLHIQPQQVHIIL